MEYSFLKLNNNNKSSEAKNKKFLEVQEDLHNQIKNPTMVPSMDLIFKFDFYFNKKLKDINFFY